MQSRVRKLRAKLHRAEQRLLEVSVDILPAVEQLVRDKRADFRAAETELAATQAAEGIRSPGEMEDVQREVLAILGDLKTHVPKLPGPEANRVVSQLVDRVDVQIDVGSDQFRSRGESRYELTGGTIFLTGT